MLINQDIVPPWTILFVSILGNEFIVVIPPVSKNTTDLGHKVLWMYCKTFENVVKQMASHHFLPQDGQIAT